jgi:MFS transporter, DHA1 family, tetracycline resistance protein
MHGWPAITTSMSEEPLPLSYAEQPSPPRGALSIIFLIVFVDLLGFGVIIPLLPFYALKAQASALQVTILFSIYSICQFVASPILGAISDKFGRRPVLAYSQLGSAIGYTLLGVVTMGNFSPHWALGLIYLSRIIDGLSGGNISTAQAYISDVTTPQTRAKGMGVLGAAFGVGFAAGPFIGGILGKYNPAWPAFAAGAFSFTAMCLTFARLPESRTHGEADAEAWLHPKRFLPIFQQPVLLNLLAIAFVSMAAFVMLESTSALFLKEPATFSWGPGQVGMYFGFLGVIIVIVQGGLIGRLTKKLGEWPLAIAGPLLVMSGMVAMTTVGFHPILAVLLFGGALNAMGRSFQTPTLYALISQNSDPKQQGTVFGLNQGLGSLARVIGPIAAGWAFERHITAPFLLSGTIMFFVMLWTIAVAARARRLVKEPALVSGEEVAEMRAAP